MFRCKRRDGSEQVLVQRLVVWSSTFDIWGSVSIVVRLQMGHDGISRLEVRFADFWRAIGEELEARRTAEDDGNDGIPCQ